MTTPAPIEKWQVGDLTIDLGRVTVTRGDEPIKITRLSFDLLLALVRAAPNVLSNEALMAEVWPGLVVAPETVVQRVKLLRHALGDDQAEPRYIGSMRSRGYWLLAEVKRIDEEAPAPRSVDHETPLDVPPTGPLMPAPEATLAPAGAPAFRTIAVAAAVVLALASFVAVRIWEPDLEAEVAGTPVDQHTVAVLPFRSLSPAPQDAFLAEGLPEIVLDRLAKLRGLTVIARYSAFRANAESRDARVLGKRLGAAYLVDGSLQRDGDRLRVTVRLVDSRRDTQLWSQTFERPAADFFSLQDAIANEVSEALRARVTGVELLHPEIRPTEDLDAYLAYLRGRALIGRFSVHDALAAADQFEHAIARDQRFAEAYAALYDARMQLADLQREDLDDARQRYRSLLDRAFALGPDSGTALYARAMWAETETASREATFRAALEREAGNTRGLLAFAEFLYASSGQYLNRASYTGTAAARIAEADGLVERAIAIDPLSPRAHFRRVVRALNSEGVAVRNALQDQLLRMDPQFYPTLERVAVYRWLMHDRPAEAIAYIERAIAADPANPWGYHAAASFYLDLDDPAAATDVAGRTPVSGVTAAVVLALFAGETTAAGAAAMHEQSFAFGMYESWLNDAALRDAALQSGQFDEAERFLRRRYTMPEGEPSIALGNFRPYVTLAHLELARGNAAEARSLLEAVIHWIDANPKFGTVFALRTRAEAEMLLGRREEALSDLREAFLKDNDHVQWWYTLRRNPIWDGVRDDPVFAVIQADVNAFLARERAALEAMRERGEVPRRPSNI